MIAARQTDSYKYLVPFNITIPLIMQIFRQFQINLAFQLES